MRRPTARWIAYRSRYAIHRLLCTESRAPTLLEAVAPDLEDGSKFYTLRKWHVATGDVVKRDEALCEIEAAAFSFDYVWEGETSVLHEKMVAEGSDDVAAGRVLAHLADPAELEELPPAVEETEGSESTEAKKKRSLIVDMDASIAGAHALVLLASLRSSTHVPFVSASYGAVPVDTALATLRKLLGALDCDHIPVVRGAATPLSGKAHAPALRLFAAGDDGIGGAPLDEPGSIPQPPGGPSASQLSAAEQLVATLRAEPLRYDVVVLGPLTNIALALRLDPGVADCIEKLVWAGGMVGGGVGTATAAAEANAWADPTAAAEVLAALTCTVVSWDAALRHSVEYEWADEEFLSSSSPAGVVAKAVTPHVYKAFEEEHAVFDKRSLGVRSSSSSNYSASGSSSEHHGGALPLPAALAMAVALQPDIVLDAKKRSVSVDASDGVCRGATVFDMRKPDALAELQHPDAEQHELHSGQHRASVVERVDATAFRRLLSESVAGEAADE